MLFNIPFEVIDMCMVPFMKNQDVFSLMRTTKEFYDQRDPSIFNDMKNIYIVGIKNSTNLIINMFINEWPFIMYYKSG